MKKFYALCGEMLQKAAREKIESMGGSLIVLQPDKRLPLPVRSHADLSCVFNGKQLIIRNEIYCAVKESINRAAEECNFEILVSRLVPGNVYPHDTGLCALYSADRLICRVKTTDPLLLHLAEKNGSELINVNQGYAKCSCALLSDGAVICEDEGIEKVLLSHGIACLRLNGRFSSLPGYDSANNPGGFIGGSCGLLGDKLCFAGDISRHPEYERIRNFCQIHRTALVSLCRDPLLDVGSIIFIENKS